MPGHVVLRTVPITADNPGAAIVLPTVRDQYALDGKEKLVMLAIKTPEAVGGELVTVNNVNETTTPSALEIPGGSPSVKIGPFLYPSQMPILFAANPVICAVTGILSMDSPSLLLSGQ